MKYWRYFLISFKCLFLLLFTGNNAWAKSDTLKLGRKLFMTNCYPCHSIGKEKVGPSLASITKKKPKDWLVNFIRNSQQIIISGDPYANHLFERYNHSVMPAFNKFTNSEIISILEYINKESINPDHDNYYDTKLEKLEKNWSSLNPQGGVLFKRHCSSCHALDREMYGPALASVTKRHTHEWLMGFIRNSRAVIKSGDSYAVDLYQKFDQKGMPAFYYLDSLTINTILKYIEYESASPSFIAGVNGHSSTMEVKTNPNIFNPAPRKIEGKISNDTTILSRIFMGLIFVVSVIFLVSVLIMLYKYLSSEFKN